MTSENINKILKIINNNPSMYKIPIIKENYNKKIGDLYHRLLEQLKCIISINNKNNELIIEINIKNIEIDKLKNRILNSTDIINQSYSNNFNLITENQNLKIKIKELQNKLFCNDDNIKKDCVDEDTYQKNLNYVKYFANNISRILQNDIYTLHHTILKYNAINTKIIYNANNKTFIKYGNKQSTALAYAVFKSDSNIHIDEFIKLITLFQKTNNETLQLLLSTNNLSFK